MLNEALVPGQKLANKLIRFEIWGIVNRGFKRLYCLSSTLT